MPQLINKVYHCRINKSDYQIMVQYDQISHCQVRQIKIEPMFKKA